MHYERWSGAETDRARDVPHGGVKPLARDLGRTAAAVRAKRARDGLALSRPARRFRAGVGLVALQCGLTAAAVGRLLGVTEGAVRYWDRRRRQSPG